MRKSRILLPVLYFLIGVSVQAQETIQDTLEIPEIAVRSPLFDTPADRIAGAVSYIPASLIDLASPRMAAEYFSQVPGMQVQPGALNTNRLIIRGIGSRAPYSTNRIRMYFGDIPLTDANGETSLADLEMNDILFAEVLKGPSSAVYGPGLGGVIRLVPRWPQNDSLGIRLIAGLGSYGLLRSGLQTRFGAGRWAFNMSMSEYGEEGYRENARFNRKNLTFMAQYAGSKNTLRMIYQRSDVRAQIPSSLTLTDFTLQPRSAASNWLNVKGYEDYLKTRAGLSLTHHFNYLISSKTVLFANQYRAVEYRPFNILDTDASTIGFRQEIRLEDRLLMLRLGTEGVLEQSISETHQIVTGLRGAFLNASDINQSQLNSYLFGSYDLEQDWHFETAFNLHISRHFPKPVFSPRIGFSFSGFSRVVLHGSAGHGFSPPTLEEALLPDGTYNSDLRPEQGWNFDLGLRTGIEQKLNLLIDFYHIRLNNLIVTERLSEDQFRGVNAGKTRHTGMELDLKILLGSWTISGKGYIARFRFEEFIEKEQDFSGNHLPGVPQIYWFNRLDWHSHFLTLYLEQQITGRQYLTDDNAKTYPGFMVWNLGAMSKWSVGETHIRISGGIRNMLNHSYPAMILVNAPSFGGNEPRYYYPAPGRNYFIGLVFDL